MNIELKPFQGENIFRIFQAIKNAGQLKIFDNVNNFKEFKDFTEAKGSFHSVYLNGDIRGFFWTDDLDYPYSCNIHFGIIKLKYATNIGRYVLKKLQEEVRIIRGDINKNNLFAKKFLTKLGFKSIGIIENYYNNGDLELHYYK